MDHPAWPVARAVVLLVAILAVARAGPAAQADSTLPALTAPVNDFAHVIDAQSAARLDQLIRALHEKTGDTVIVVTVKTVRPAYADAREYAVKLFENRGRGIGEKEQDNGALILVAVEDRQVWIEVGYGLEGFIPDAFAGDTSRRYMAPYFKQGQYGAGLVAGVEHIIERIAERRKIELGKGPTPSPPQASSARAVPFWVILLGLLFIIWMMSRMQRSALRSRRVTRGPWQSPWSGWPGGFSGGSWGGFGNGGFGGGGGGFGGFGGGASGGGGGGTSW